MYQISKIGLQNYRVFDDTKMHEIAIAPITIITGANSSGKSSVFKALMLLEENRRQSNLFKLYFSGFSHLLGSFDSIRNQYSNDLIDFSLIFIAENQGIKEEIRLILSFQKQSKEIGILKSCAFLLNDKSILTIQSQNQDNYKIEIDFVPFRNQAFNFGDFYDKGLLLKKLDDNLFRNLYEEQLKYDIKNEQSFLGQDEIKKIIAPKRAEIDAKKNKIQEQIDKLIEKQDELINKQNEYKEELGKYSKELDKLENRLKELDENDEKYQALTIERSKLDKQITSLESRINDLENQNESLSKKINGSKEIKGLKDVQIEFESKFQNFLNEIEQDVLRKTDEKTNELIDKQLNLITDEQLTEYKNKTFENLTKAIIIYQLTNLNSFSKEDISTNDFFKKVKEHIQNVLSEKLAYFEEEQQQPSLASLLDLQFEGYESPFQELSGIQERITYKNFYQNLVGRFLDILQNIELPFRHLPAVRGKQERIITFSNQNDVLESTVLNLLQTNYNPHNPSLDEVQIFIRKWLPKFEIGYDILIDVIDGSSVRLKILNDENDTEGRNLADFGLGISQLLPIILTCATVQTNTLICIEEPETNLHPKFQSMLAEMFVDAHKEFKVQFALETHSEYLIRKMQLLAIDKKNENYISNDKINLYYFDKGGKVREIKIKDNGNLSDDFGEGFFDEADNLAMRFHILKQKNK